MLVCGSRKENGRHPLIDQNLEVKVLFCIINGGICAYVTEQIIFNQPRSRSGVKVVYQSFADVARCLLSARSQYNYLAVFPSTSSIVSWCIHKVPLCIFHRWDRLFSYFLTMFSFCDVFISSYALADHSRWLVKFMHKTFYYHNHQNHVIGQCYWGRVVSLTILTLQIAVTPINGSVLYSSQVATH